MRRSVSGGDGHSRWCLVGGSSKGVKRRLGLRIPAIAAVLFAFAASLGVSPKATAADNGADSISSLQAYVQSSDGNSGKAGSALRDDRVYQALHDFAQKLGDDRPAPKDATRLAANSLMEWLSQGGGQNSAAPTEPPKAPAGAKAKRHEPLVAATTVGSKVCLGCHAKWAEQFNHTLMGRLVLQGKLQCETCHGPGSEHVRLGGGRGVGGILSFLADDPRSTDEKNAVCLGCHERGDRTYWNGSTHQTRGLACTNCHTIMKAVSRKFQLKTAWQPDTCFQCHKDRKAQLYRSSHMPIREGKLVCSDCHNPHGSQTAALLRGDSINDTCYTCHAEKRGPFLFEHAPVRENCDNCHVPHGSVNEFLLRIPRQRLCSTCHGIGHGLNAGPLAVQSIGRSCQNCHNAVHGTNDPSGALLHR
jgi:DmsE family decaheme c-type cytochrome